MHCDHFVKTKPPGASSSTGKLTAEWCGGTAGHGSLGYPCGSRLPPQTIASRMPGEPRIGADVGFTDFRRGHAEMPRIAGFGEYTDVMAAICHDKRNLEIGEKVECSDLTGVVGAAR
jgi:hypothetical protein